MLYVDGGQEEPLRAHMRSRFVYGDEIDPVRVIVARLPVGAGQLVIDLFEVPRDELGQPRCLRHLRIARRLLANLGSRVEGSVFDGTIVSSALIHSPGWPADLFIRATPPEAGEWEQLRAACTFTAERTPAKPIRSLGEWVLTPGLDGVWSFAKPPAFAYMVVEVARPRKIESAVVGFPNPEQLTCLTVDGDGRAELWVNGIAFPALALGAKSRWTDIPLEQGNNHILLRLIGVTRLALRFETLMRQPETEFKFAHWG